MIDSGQLTNVLKVPKIRVVERVQIKHFNISSMCHGLPTSRKDVFVVQQIAT